METWKGIIRDFKVENFLVDGYTFVVWNSYYVYLLTNQRAQFNTREVHGGISKGEMNVSNLNKIKKMVIIKDEVT